MAGAGYKLFNTGDVLTAAQVNTYLQEQAVMRFANSTARTTALSGVLAEGMMSYLDDTNSVEVYNGSAWVSVGSTGDITGVTAGTGISGGGTSGDVTITNSMATAIDAKGDLIVGTGADTFARLAVGTNGHTLVADSATATGLKWAAPAAGSFVGCRLDKNAAQTLTTGVWTALTFDIEDYDTDGFHSNTTNNSRITIPSGKSGYYLVQCQVTWAANGTGYRLGYVDANASGNALTYLSWDGNINTGRFTQYYSFTDYLTAGDYIQMWALQNSGGNLNVEGRNYTNFGTSFQVSYLGA